MLFVALSWSGCVTVSGSWGYGGRKLRDKEYYVAYKFTRQASSSYCAMLHTKCKQLLLAKLIIVSPMLEYTTVG